MRSGWLVAASIIVLSGPTLGATASGEERTPRVIESERNDLSPPMRLMRNRPVTPADPREIPNRSVGDEFRQMLRDRSRPAPLKTDPLWQLGHGRRDLTAPLVSFDGILNTDNGAVLGGQVAPPDTNGDVGPNHYVQWNNLVFEVWDKSGNSLLGPLAGNSLFAGFGGFCETTNDGDPIVLYDQLADRWLLTQFAPNNSRQCVAISQTPDPTGSYYRYEFVVSNDFNDYEKLGVWPDGYYMSHNDFGPTFKVVVSAMERDAMLRGHPAKLVLFDLPPDPVSGDFFFSIEPSHLEGRTPPPVGSPNYFVMAFDDEDAGGTPNATQDLLKIWEFHVDWANPGSSTFTGPKDIVTSEFDTNMCNFSRDCIPEPPGGTLVDAISGFTMYRAAYRNLPNLATQTIVTNVTVDVDGADTAGIRWFEIRGPGDATPTLHQEGTHSPDADHRWMGSIAQDKDGNIALGYSVSSLTTNPSVRYAGRLESDPLGTLPLVEQSIVAGTGFQNATNRWGDYSSMSIDESDDCTFWYTQEYYEATGGFADWSTRIGAFQVQECTPAAPLGAIEGFVTDSVTGDPIPTALVKTDDGYSGLPSSLGAYSIVLPAGTHDLTASAFGWFPGTASSQVVTSGATTVVNFSLVAAQTTTVSGTVTDGSGAGWPLYARIDVEAVGSPDQTIFTDPTTGAYSVDVVDTVNYTFTVNAVGPGYLEEVRAVTNAAPSQDFSLLVDLSCTAPGYVANTTPVLTTDFTGAFPPVGMTVVNNSTSCANPADAWSLSDPAGRGNLTGGAGNFANIDSDACGPAAAIDTDLVTPTFDASVDDAVQISFSSDYFDLCDGGTDAVSVDIWDGSTWVTVFDFCGADRRGPRTETFATNASSSTTAQVRWHYVAGWDWHWQVDDVAISTLTCGLSGDDVVSGFVTDAVSGEGLVGADVSGTTASTNGYYALNLPTAVTLTATATGYMPLSQAVAVTGSNQQVDFALQRDGGDFFSIDPCRVLDTRDPFGALGGPALGGAEDRMFKIAGVCNIPSTARAIAFNIAVVGPTNTGNLRLHPGGSTVPLVASINFNAGQTIANNGVVPLNSNGEVAIFNAVGVVGAILDVTGYFE